jgi:hypothetical protein
MPAMCRGPEPHGPRSPTSSAAASPNGEPGRFDGFVAGLGDVLHKLHSLGLTVPRADRP